MEDIEEFRADLLAWYAANKRDIGWRETTDPYEILVAEVMSQQTQLSRAEDAWEEFIERWPTVDALANDSQDEVVSFWTGHSLGYNNRAKWLHRTATQVVDNYDGTFPETPEELEAFPGVGPYTSNAVASFAFNNGNATIDTNVKRVLYRVFDVEDDDDAFEELGNKLLPTGESRDWNNAIMELGATVCTPTPKCDDCPVSDKCRAYQTGDFTAPDVPEQPDFEGSRRQFRGRVIGLLNEHDTLTVDQLGYRLRVDYQPEELREWLNGLISDLVSDELVERTTNDDGETIVQLRE